MLESVRAFRRRAWEVRLVVPEHGPLVELPDIREEVRIEQFSVLRKELLSVRGLATLTICAPRELIAAWRIIKRCQADAVYVNTITIPLWVVAALIARVPAIVHVHEAEQSVGKVLRLALAAPLLLAKRIIVNSEAARDATIAGSSRLEKKTVKIYNGVPDPLSTESLHREQAVFRRKGRVAYVGRISPRKGLDIAVKAVHILNTQGVSVYLDVYGSTFPGYEWYERSIREMIAAYALSDHITLHGHVFPIHDKVAAAECLLVPSRTEPFGNVAVEGMLAQTPVIASKVQGLTEIIDHGRTGLLVEPEDPAALAQAISWVLVEPEEARRIGSAGRADALARFGIGSYASAITLAVEGLMND